MYSWNVTSIREYSTLYHNLPCNASFWAFLFSIDQDLANNARQKACPCGGRLHSAKYPRKPRGGDNLPEQYGYRLSFCCERDGSAESGAAVGTVPWPEGLPRRRGPSGRGHATGALPAAGPRAFPTLRRRSSDDRLLASVLGRTFSADTVLEGRAHRLLPPVAIEILPLSLLEAFSRSDDPCQDWGRLLLFLSPITVTGDLVIDVSR